MLGAAVDGRTMEVLARVDRIPQIQTYRLQWAIIHAIESALGRAIDVLATVPTRDWPFTRKVFWAGRPARRGPDGAGRWVQMPMVNLLGLKQISRLVGSWTAVLAWLRRNRGCRNKVIVNYGLIQPHLLSALVLGRLFGANVVAIVTDPPLTYHDEGALRRWAKRFDRWLLAGLLRRLDGVIALTEGLAELLAPGVPALVMEGIVSDDVERFAGERSQKPDFDRLSPGRSEARGQRSEAFIIMYAGQLHADYGVRAMVEAFGQLEGERFNLWLFGQGTMEEEIRQAAIRDPRISFFGFQGPEVIFPRMRQASVMVVPRPVEGRIAPYSFPSKLLEYMAMGKIVVCSNLPGIPADYLPHLVMVDQVTPEALASALREVAGRSIEKRTAMGGRVREFVWANKTQRQQGRRIVEFLGQVVRN